MVDQYISQFIPGMLPSFYQAEGPTFVAFVQAYFEWLESEGGVVWNSRNIANFKDIDQTPNQFLQYFKDEYLNGLPNTLVADQRLLIKHITDLYKAKGSKRGYELLFRILFNEDIRIYLPGENLFKPSDNEWTVPNYIEITDSPYLQNLVGNKIYSSDFSASALVEEYIIVNNNNKVINVLYLSNVNGNFSDSQYILCKDVPEITINNAPLTVGSLSAVAIENGGIFFNVGDEVSISGSGSGATGRVISTKTENGKVTFDLVTGGYGYTLNAQVTVNGGNGSGATFQIGSLINQQVMVLNIDVINTYYNTQLDNASSGSNLHISNTVGVFTVGETINATANGIALDFAYISGNSLVNNEILSNSSLGISGLQIIEIDNPNFVNLTGPDASLTNANLVPGVILIGGTSGNTIYVNTVLPKVVYAANATVTFANSTLLTTNNNSGYFLPTSNVHGQTSGASAYLNQNQRNTNWGFPVGFSTNLDTSIFNTLTYESIIVGTISSISFENPGDGYTANPTVSILEPLVYQLQLPDGQGGYWGGDANVVASANNSNGIMTAVKIIDSGFGYNPNETLLIYSNNVYTASGSAVVDGTGVAAGYWKNNKSFLSDTIYLQDSYYYQPYSYEIIAPRMLETYQKFVNDLIHPVGMVLFGRFSIVDSQFSNNQIISSTVVLQ